MLRKKRTEKMKLREKLEDPWAMIGWLTRFIEQNRVARKNRKKH